MTDKKPNWWFKTVEEARELESNPVAIEFLKCVSGETFVHCGGTAFWDRDKNQLRIDALAQSQITHWRVAENPLE